MDIDFRKTHINPKSTSAEDVNKFLEQIDVENDYFETFLLAAKRADVEQEFLKFTAHPIGILDITSEDLNIIKDIKNKDSISNNLNLNSSTNHLKNFENLLNQLKNPYTTKEAQEFLEKEKLRQEKEKIIKSKISEKLDNKSGNLDTGEYWITIESKAESSGIRENSKQKYKNQILQKKIELKEKRRIAMAKMKGQKEQLIVTKIFTFLFSILLSLLIITVLFPSSVYVKGIKNIFDNIINSF